ncbi:MAG: GNAT family protein [Actinomycetes bacterium]
MFPRESIAAGALVLRPAAGDDPAAAPAADRAVALAECGAEAAGAPVPGSYRPAPCPPGGVRHRAAAAWERGGAAFTVAEAGTGRPLGAVALTPPDARGTAGLGYLIAPRERRRGLAVAAVRALTAWAFRHGLARAEIRCDVENLAAQRVALAAGFAREGTLRAALPRPGGDRADAVLFARLPRDPGDPVRPYLPPPPDALTDGVVRLTPLTAADARDYHALACLPEVVRYAVPPLPPPYEDSLYRCRHAGARWLAGERADLAIRDAATGAFAGHVQLANVVPPLGEATIGYSVSPAYRGRGFAPRAVELLVGWAFAATPLVRIVAGTAADNAASHRVLEKAGFTREAVLRGRLPGVDGARHDDVQWVRTRRDAG